METITGQARKWIYPRIGEKKLGVQRDDAERFFSEIAQYLSKRTLVMIKSTLRRSIRRAQVHDLIGRNVIELIDLPAGKPGRPSRAMTEEQAGKVLKAAERKASGYVRVVKASNGRYGATHAATDSDKLACGTRPHPKASITEVGRELKEATCRSCRTQLGLDNAAKPTSGWKRSSSCRSRSACARRAPQAHLGPRRPRPGRGPRLALASKTGDTKTPQSKRSLVLPKRAITALKAHRPGKTASGRRRGLARKQPGLLPRGRHHVRAAALNWRFSG